MAETSIPPRLSRYGGDWIKRTVPAGGSCFLREYHGNGVSKDGTCVSDGYAFMGVCIPHRVGPLGQRH